MTTGLVFILSLQPIGINIMGSKSGYRTVELLTHHMSHYTISICSETLNLLASQYSVLIHPLLIHHLRNVFSCNYIFNIHKFWEFRIPWCMFTVSICSKYVHLMFNMLPSVTTPRWCIVLPEMFTLWFNNVLLVKIGLGRFDIPSIIMWTFTCC